jgi:uncharacterized cupin superfamily protein
MFVLGQTSEEECLEGTCTIIVGEQENKLVAGDYSAIKIDCLLNF